MYTYSYKLPSLPTQCVYNYSNMDVNYTYEEYKTCYTPLFVQ